MPSTQPPRFRSRRLGGPPPRLALGVDSLEFEYQAEVVRGAARAAVERGASLCIFARGVTDPRLPHQPGLFRYVNAEYFHSLVLLTGTLTSTEPEELIRNDFADFYGSHLVSIGVAISGCHSILIDNERGMAEVIEHLVVKHGRRRVVFLRGPRTNHEAEDRYRAYVNVLEANGLPLDERLVVDCTFQRGSGTEAIATLFDKRRLRAEDIDAVVGADDLMALEAMQEIARRGLHVPSQVAIAGFDDMDEAKYSNPPLTSVRQPLIELGKEGVRLLLSGEETPKSQALSTHAHLRRSCGCLFEEASMSVTPPSLGTLDVEAQLIRRRDLILAEMTRAARAAFTGVPRGWEVRLFNAMTDELRGQYGTFRTAFDRLLEAVLAADNDVAAANPVLSAMRKQLSQCVQHDIAAERHLETVLHEARILTCAVVERAQAQKRLKMEYWSRTLAEVGSRLALTHNRDHLSQVMASEMPRVGINTCVINRFIDPAGTESEVVAGFTPHGVVDRHAIEAFPTTQVVSDWVLSVDERTTLVVEPLTIEGVLVGTIVLSYAEVPGYVYAVMRQLLTSAVHASAALRA